MEELEEADAPKVTENENVTENESAEAEVNPETAAEKSIEGVAITDAVTDGANLVEEFSPHGTAEKVGQYTKLSEKVVHYVMAVIYIALGVVCVAATKYMLLALSYVVGSFMAVIGILQLISAIKSKEFVQTNSNKTAGSLILIALAVMILIDHEWADTFIPIVWGVIGLVEGAHAFNHAFSRIARGMRCSYYLVKGIIEVVLAFLLLYEPAHHITLHIIVFGVNLIFDGVTMLPVVKKFIASR